MNMRNKILVSVSILFKPEAREQIKAAAEIRGLELSPSFDTEGQTFDAPYDYHISEGTVDVVAKALDNSGDICVYSYPLSDVARVKSRWTDENKGTTVN
ncbi:hypothetical protein [Vibrio phage JSF12]|uniref:Uncharacterized protein n=2 Tax=Jesfedecavirus TaxID=2560156 RepID=A0A2D0YLY9_9CAUD|nr:hypothetical protein FDI98_gp046 [Vibrio phage JSF10]YP_009794778.1 hypothetical protein HOS35_gp095 [Vibrio phage JSF12]ASV43486.1 hypothetical protein [Vibrio phage JSF10]ASV43613.1 hypothetical protein [Vibrio phage JSF12]